MPHIDSSTYRPHSAEHTFGRDRTGVDTGGGGPHSAAHLHLADRVCSNTPLHLAMEETASTRTQTTFIL